MNAHRRRLDVWLLLRCSVCERVVRLPILERVHTDDLAASDRDAYTRNDTARADAEALNRGLVAAWEVCGERPEVPFVAHLEIPVGLEVRLDRLLAKVLELPRQVVQDRARSGRIQLLHASPRALRRPACDGQQVVVLP